MSKDTIEWSDEYSFGLPDIDNEHKTLFAHLNRLIEASKLDEGQEIAVGVSVKFLIDYVTEHFKAEEEMFEQTDYPKIEEHKKTHEYLKRYVLAFEKEYMAGDHESLDKFIPVAKDWLTNDILKVDTEYVEYCKEKGVGVKSCFHV